MMTSSSPRASGDDEARLVSVVQDTLTGAQHKVWHYASEVAPESLFSAHRPFLAERAIAHSHSENQGKRESGGGGGG